MASPTPTASLADNHLPNAQHRRASSFSLSEDSSSIILDEPSDAPVHKRLIIAIDFGTTFSAVSYVAVPEGSSPESIDPRSIRSIKNYPESWNFSPRDQMLVEVPTEVMYPLNHRFREQKGMGTGVMNTMPDPAREDDAEDNFGIHTEVDAQHNGDGDTVMSTDNSTCFRWGYEVHELWSLPSTHSDNSYQPLSRFKLMLDESEETELVRDHLDMLLSQPRMKRVLKNREMIITDFLTSLLRHTQSELWNEGFDNTYRRELVLCVPAIWTQKACRVMQTCLADAIRRATFQGVDVQNNSIENLFIVSEPEAAAEHMLTADGGLMCGDVFVLLDAGGGTVDANTYEISSRSPLRLSREVVPVDGGLYGSSYLNQGFREYLKNLLADETYLEQGPETIDGIIEKIIVDHFEYRVKRTFDCFTATGYKQFAVSGLRDNPSKNFIRGCIRVPVEKINEIFLSRLKGIATIMERQISGAMAIGCRVEMVVLIGGFAASISLKKYLTKHLERFNRQNWCHVTLMTPPPESTVNAVASGAVLRALNKAHGPQRIARSSYGILRAEPFGEHREHEGLKPSYDLHDGMPYIKNAVDWVLKLGSCVPSVWQCAPFLCSHTFDLNTRQLMCREVLYVSDRATESHYRLKHPNNEGAQAVGEIVVDFTFLRHQGLIKPIEPTTNEMGRKIGTRHFKVNFTMIIRVVDRDLECYAIYNKEVKKKCRLNIASGFRPGVK